MGSKEGTLKGMSSQNQQSKGYNVLTISSMFSFAETAQGVWLRAPVWSHNCKSLQEVTQLWWIETENVLILKCALSPSFDINPMQIVRLIWRLDQIDGAHMSVSKVWRWSQAASLAEHKQSAWLCSKVKEPTLKLAHVLVYNWQRQSQCTRSRKSATSTFC